MNALGQPVDFAAVFTRLADTDAAEETITLGGMNVRMVRFVEAVWAVGTIIAILRRLRSSGLAISGSSSATAPYL